MIDPVASIAGFDKDRCNMNHLVISKETKTGYEQSSI